MKTKLLFIVAMAATFGSGYAFRTFTAKQQQNNTNMTAKKVTGIGGVFFKCKEPKELMEWYKNHLGLNTNDYGVTFKWREEGETAKEGATQWSPFSDSTKYFEPSKKDFMINYRVENLEELVAELKKEGVTVVDDIATYDFGKFVHIIDLEGNAIELWEPK